MAGVNVCIQFFGNTDIIFAVKCVVAAIFCMGKTATCRLNIFWEFFLFAIFQTC